MKLVLEVLEAAPIQYDFNNYPMLVMSPDTLQTALAALRQAISEAEQEEKQEPVAWHHPKCNGQCIACLIEKAVEDSYGTQGREYMLRRINTAPPQREWVSLTDDEVESVGDAYFDEWSFGFARAIEAKLKEKNCGAA